MLQLNTHLVNQEEDDDDDYESSIDDEIKRIDDYYYNNQISNKLDEMRILSDSNSISSKSNYKNVSFKSDIKVIVEPKNINGKIKQNPKFKMLTNIARCLRLV